MTLPVSREWTVVIGRTLDHVARPMANPGDFAAEWKFSLSDGSHSVQFQHGTTSGKRVVIVDGKEVLRKNWMFHLVGKETFDVSGKKACVHIDAKGMSYEYWLEVGGKPLEKFLEQRKKSTKSWLPVVLGNYHRVVLEKDKMEVYVDGERVETAVSISGVRICKHYNDEIINSTSHTVL